MPYLYEPMQPDCCCDDSDNTADSVTDYDSGDSAVIMKEMNVCYQLHGMKFYLKISRI